MKHPHPYLTNAYLTRGPHNYCMNCGKKLSISPTNNWGMLFYKPLHSKEKLLGYYHYPICNNKDDKKCPLEQH